MSEERLEFPVPAFDHGKIHASYVVTLPKGYDKGKSWPLILDFHGAIAPSRKGANLTRRTTWSKLRERLPCVVAGLNGRTRAWNIVRGEKNDSAYARQVLAEVRRQYSIEPTRIYLAGFSSGSDFLCSGGLQLDGEFAGSLVICPGPPNVVGLRGGDLLKAKRWPFYFATGEEDYIRKSGAWKAFLALDKAGGKVMYREVPRKGHEFLGADEYARLFTYLELMAQGENGSKGVKVPLDAIERRDYLLASTRLLLRQTERARQLLAEIEKKGTELAAKAEAINIRKEPGRAYEAWWRLLTQFHRFKPLADRARSRLEIIEKEIPARDLYRARRDWFRRRPKAVSHRE